MDSLLARNEYNDLDWNSNSAFQFLNPSRNPLLYRASSSLKCWIHNWSKDISLYVNVSRLESNSTFRAAINCSPVPPIKMQENLIINLCLEEKISITFPEQRELLKNAILHAKTVTETNSYHATYKHITGSKRLNNMP